MFVFRNNTVERFFPKGYSFSGYDDISVIPEDTEGYVWFFQVPVKYDPVVVAEEVRGYAGKLEYVLNHVSSNRTVIALTMTVLYTVPFSEDDTLVADAVSDYNVALYDFAKRYANVRILDFGEFISRYPSEELLDWKFYFISQMGLNPKLSKDFTSWWLKMLDGIALKRKKCIVLDLDNTLWGGVLGEEGIDGIRIGGDYPGNAFRYWQEALLELSKSGVILTVCSKNNEQDVLDAWEGNPYILLKKEHFASYRINWKDKATNVREIAEELNIGLDTLVFIDDNPTERELIRQMLPMVAVPEFPEQPYGLPAFFRQVVNDYFKVYSITDEDRKKTEQYKANAARAQAQASFSDLTSFLSSLNIRITVESMDDFNVRRIAQMTQKTNQFNLTTKRYTDSDIKGFASDGWRIWCISVADRFGDNGITGCIMVTPEGFVDTFLLSCRILGKGIEKAFVRKVFELLGKQGFSRLTAMYCPTAKNAQVAGFWDSCGFSLDSVKEGVKTYSLDLKDADIEIDNYYHIIVK